MSMLEIEKETARLDGFLYGVAALSGSIRSYSAYAYVIEPKEGASIEQSLKDSYPWDPEMAFSEVRCLDNGLRDLEIEIRPLLVRDVFRPNADALQSLQSYLSFRVMDMISLIRGDQRIVDVFKLTSAAVPLTSECVYFCIEMEMVLTVLQFNNDIPYIRSLGRNG